MFKLPVAKKVISEKKMSRVIVNFATPKEDCNFFLVKKTSINYLKNVLFQKLIFFSFIFIFSPNLRKLELAGYFLETLDLLNSNRELLKTKSKNRALGLRSQVVAVVSNLHH